MFLLAMQAVGYCRCSTDKRDESVSIQKQEIQKYADKHGYDITHWYIDDGISGLHNEDRPDFLRLLADSGGATWRFVIVRNQSRFSRVRPVTMARYLDRLDKSGAQLVTTDRGIIDPDHLIQYLISSIESNTDNEYSKSTIIFAIAKLLFVCSLGFPAFYVTSYDINFNGAMPGYLCLLLSPVGLVMGFPETLANVLFGIWWIGLGRRTKPFRSLVLTLLAVIFASIFLTRTEFPAPSHTGPDSNPIVFGLGCFLWLGSMLLAFIGSVVLIFTAKKQING